MPLRTIGAIWSEKIDGKSGRFVECFWSVRLDKRRWISISPYFRSARERGAPLWAKASRRSEKLPTRSVIKKAADAPDYQSGSSLGPPLTQVLVQEPLTRPLIRRPSRKKTSLQIATNEPIKVCYIIPAPEKGGGLDWDERHRLCSECSLSVRNLMVW